MSEQWQDIDKFQGCSDEENKKYERAYFDDDDIRRSAKAKPGSLTAPNADNEPGLNQTVPLEDLL